MDVKMGVYMGFEMEIQRLMDAAVAEGEVAGVNLLVRKNDEELFYAESGFADKENQVSVRRDSIFRLYSMSKPITAAAALLLIERGVFELNTPVAKFLPAFEKQILETGKPPQRLIVIKDLLSMRSGMTYPSADHAAGRLCEKTFNTLIAGLDHHTMSTVDVANALAQVPLRFEPGSEFMYGTSADILGAVIEVASKMPFGEFLKKEFFEPLGMKDTGFFVEKENLSRLARVYEPAADGMKEFVTNHLGIRYDMDQAPAFESGGAGLVSTVDDYAKFGQMLLNGGTFNGKRILKEKTVEVLTTGQLPEEQKRDFWSRWETLSGYNYGNLMRIMESPGLAYMVATDGEYGWDGWLGAYFSNHPKEKITFIMMMQKRDAGTTEFTRRLRNLVLTEIA